MDWNNITIQDCIDMHEKKSKCTVLNDGKVVDFVEDEENGTLQTMWR